MPIPHAVTRVNRRWLNPVMRRLVGIGPLVELEHVGRRSGAPRRTPLMAFRHGDTVTVALTYGPDVDWLKNIRAAGTCRLRMGRQVLTLGAVTPVDAGIGLGRVPPLARAVLRAIRCTDYVELPVMAEEPAP